MKALGSDKRTRQKSVINIACGQVQPKLGFLEENREESLEIIDAAARKHVDLLVFPELCNSGCIFESRGEAKNNCESIPKGKTIRLWEEAARQHEMYIAAGIAEIDASALYNSAVLISPDGYVGKYRKLHLWDNEKLFFAPGDLGLPVFETRIGRIGLQICYDQWFFEVTRILSLQGADIIAGPANWSYDLGRPLSTENDTREKLGGKWRFPMQHHIAVVNAHLNSVWVVYCNRTGAERGRRFIGKSIICAPSGLPAVGPASRGRQELLVAKGCNVLEARTKKTWGKLNTMPTDRRTDVYDEMLGYRSVGLVALQKA